MKLENGKVAFVTGGAHGIGRETAVMLARRGVNVVSFDKDASANRELEQLHRKILGIYCDCEDVKQICEGFAQAIERVGTVDILVNNAGDFVLSSFLRDPFEKGLTSLERMLRLFVGSTYAFTQLAAPIMAEAGAGAIINVLTNHLHREVCRVSPEEHAYDAAKYAQMSLNMTMAAELYPYGIRVNAVSPAATYTGMLRDFFVRKGEETTVEYITKKTNNKTLMMPQDVALAICNLIAWENPAPVGKHFLLQNREDCEKLKEIPEEGQDVYAGTAE